MPGRVESEGVAARLRITGRGASDVVEMVDAFDDFRARLGLISGALGVELDFSLIRAGRDSRILLICSSKGIDGEMGDFTFIGEAGMVDSDVSRATSWSGKGFDEALDASLLCLLRLFFTARLRGGFDD